MMDSAILDDFNALQVSITTVDCSPAANYFDGSINFTGEVQVGQGPG